MTLYLPISTASLPHYVTAACVKPACCFKNKPEDIQNTVPQHLLLSESPCSRLEGCCIALELLDNETSRLTPAGKGWFLFDSALPMSRVYKILFPNEVNLAKSRANITLSTAFLPARLCVTSTEEAFTAPFLPATKPDTPGLSEKAAMFDRLLGAFAMLRITSPSNLNVPESYFGMLGLLCPEVMEEGKKVFGNRFTGKFQALLSQNTDDSVIKLLSGRITEKEVETIAHRENQELTIDKVTGLIDADRLKGQAYILAILATYGLPTEASRKNIDELAVSGFQRNIRPGMNEIVAAYYGYNRGYSIFPKFFAVSPVVKKYAKFRFDSLVDYYTVESVYRHVFLNRPTPKCPGLETWWPRKAVSDGAKTILDYSVTPLPLRRFMTDREFTTTREPWFAPIVRRQAARFDPMQSTLYTFGLDVAADVVRATPEKSPVQEAASPCDRIVDRTISLMNMSLKELQHIMIRSGARPAKGVYTKEELVKAIIMAELHNLA